MRRFICVSAEVQAAPPINIVYHARGVKFISQYRLFDYDYTPNDGLGPSAMQCPIMNNDVVRLQVPVTLRADRRYCFLLNIDENQPNAEFIEVTTASDNRITAEVYNENGVLVCSAVSPQPVSGGTASEPIEAPGEMTSEPIGGPGEMTSEPIDGSGEMTSDPSPEPVETV